MATPEDKEKQLYVEILKGDLDAYRKLETWGSSLFLGALGLVAKQLVDWDLNPDPLKHIPLTTVMAALPAAVGLTAFVFLRVVNFRSHKTGRKLRELAGRPNEGLRTSCTSWGMLGILLAIMPLLFGYVVSWSLTAGHPDWKCLLVWLTTAGGLVLLGALVIHFRVRSLKNPTNHA